jgi:DNA-binding phage protein
MMAMPAAVKEGPGKMPLSRSFKETVKARVDSDPAFRDALLKESLELVLTGEVDTGKLVLRDYINATIGFETLAREIGTSSKSLMRMLSPKGNLLASNLFAVIGQLQRRVGLCQTLAAGS